MQLAVLVLAMAALLSFVGECVATDKLIQSTDMTYLGAFKGPVDPAHGGTMWYTDYPDPALAFRAARAGAPNGSLYASGHNYYASILEGAIPATLSTSSNLADLPRMTLLQPLTPIFAGMEDCIYTGGSCIDGNTQYGGLMVEGNQLIATRWDYYANATGQERAWFKHGLDLSVSDGVGAFRPSSHPRAVSGYITKIPANWRTALGGDALSGLFEVPIVSSTSEFPSASSFNLSDLTSPSSVVNVNTLMYTACPGSPHTVLGCFTNTTPANSYTSNSEGYGGAVFPAGSKTLLVFHVHGNGDSCYGESTLNPALHGQVACGTGGTEMCCYDPESSAKGGHSYPYSYQVQAFSADDLAAVKAGTKASNALMPYAVWDLTFPQAALSHAILGVAYDESTQRIYLRQAVADGTAPVYQVMQLNLSASSPPPTGTTRSLNGRLRGSWH